MLTSSYTTFRTFVVISQQKQNKEQFIHVVNQRLDYANALLYGLPKCVIYNLQKVQNSAARTLTVAPRSSVGLALATSEMQDDL